MVTDLFGTDSSDSSDRRSALVAAGRTRESDEKRDPSKYGYQPNALAAAKPVYVTNAADKQRLEEKQLELYESDE